MYRTSILNPKWLVIGLGVKRWILAIIVGIGLIGYGFAHVMLRIEATMFTNPRTWTEIIVLCVSGVILICIALLKLSRNLLAPYRMRQHGHIVDVVYAHSRRHRGIRVVAIGGGSGLPSVLRGLKPTTRNITAVVTVADDGGSSGRLRRDIGMIPPGDLRNNIAALADDEGLMTRLFQYRFDQGDLTGHSFGNLFIAALAGLSGGIEAALPELERILNIQGRVLPATLEDVNLIARVRMVGKTQTIQIRGESRISQFGGHIEQVSLSPPDVQAYGASVQAIEQADMIVIGPGSLYTSIIPNLLVPGIAEALRNSNGVKVYVVNVATQPGETENYSVADHVMALETHIGRGVFQIVLANNATPRENAGVNTHYVSATPPEHEISQRYQIMYADLTDPQRPWRHDPGKLALALLRLRGIEGDGIDSVTDPVFSSV